MELTNSQPNNIRVRRKEDKAFNNQVLLTDRVVYDYYRKHRRRQSKTIDQFNYFVKAVEGLMKTLRDMMVESEGGIYIEGFGYFANIRVRKRRSRKNLLIRNTQHVPYFFPDREFEKWTFSSMFRKELKVKLGKSKLKYKLHFDICESKRKSDEIARRYYELKRKSETRDLISIYS